MGFFGPSKKIISEREYRDLRSRLYSLGFTRRELDNLTMIFRADLEEPESSQYGIDQGELERGIAWMRENMRIHDISDRKIDIFEEEAKKKF